MSLNLYFIFVILTTIVAYSDCLDNITFNNVSIWTDYWHRKIGTISSSKTLKGHIPIKNSQSVLIGGKIPVLWEDSVSDIDDLKNIKFWMNEMEEIRPGAFKNLKGIETIEINYNNPSLTTLNEGAFQNLPVRDITLFNNSIFKIEVGAFRNLPQLKSLNLHLNKLETLPEGIFDGLSNLQNLDLSQNEISSLPENVFRNLPNLQLILLLGNKLDHIPVEVFANLPVSYLDLSFNSISTLPKGVFKNFPKNGIVLTGNKITTVPEGVFNNHLTLDQVNLASNKISYIAPNAFDDMPELANIFLSNNLLSEYNTNWFHNTPRIYRLHMSHNLFEEIPDEAFRNIYNEKKQWIKLDRNKIKTISPNVFKGLKNFDTLDLADNGIESWNESILADTEVIYRLHLGDNKIKCVDGDFDNVFKANYTYLYRNPLSSDCVQKIEEWVAQDRPQKHLVCLGNGYCIFDHLY